MTYWTWLRLSLTSGAGILSDFSLGIEQFDAILVAQILIAAPIVVSTEIKHFTLLGPMSNSLASMA